LQAFSIIGVPVVPVVPVFPLFFTLTQHKWTTCLPNKWGPLVCKFLSGLEYWKLEQLEQLEQNS